GHSDLHHGLDLQLVTVACYFKAQRRISQLAREDALTGLPNRRFIDEVFRRTLNISFALWPEATLTISCLEVLTEGCMPTKRNTKRRNCEAQRRRSDIAGICDAF